MDEDATSLWQQAENQGETWALARRIRLQEQKQPASAQQKTKDVISDKVSGGFISRRQKLIDLKKAKKIHHYTALYIGNDPQTIEGLTSLLDDFECEHTGNPKQALEILSHKTFTSIIIEYDLPMANAIQFLNTFGTFCSLNEQIVAILVPKTVDPSNKKIAARLGVKLWLEKPFASHVLTSCIKRLVEKSHEP